MRKKLFLKVDILFRGIFYPFFLLGVFGEIYQEYMKGCYYALFPNWKNNQLFSYKSKRELLRRLKKPISKRRQEYLILQIEKCNKPLIQELQ